MMKIVLAVAALIASGCAALAQTPPRTLPCYGTPASCVNVAAGTPLPVTGSFTPSGTQNVNLTQILGAAPSATNPLWVAPATASTPWVSIQSSQYPSGATPITASATGTTGATTATLAGTSGKTTYICGMSIRANATAAATGNATVTGTITGTLNFTQWTAPLASGLGITEMVFMPCVPASATNTGIAIISAAPGSGGVVSSTGWGYQL